MKAKKLPLVMVGILSLLIVMLTGIRGLAQEANGDVYLPAVFKPNGESALTKTASVTLSASATASGTPTATATQTPTSTGSVPPEPTPDCALLEMTDFEIRQYNRPVVKIINNNPGPVTITQFGLEWVSADVWAHALGYHDIHIDWFKWDGNRFYEGDDYDEPTFVNAAITIEPGDRANGKLTSTGLAKPIGLFSTSLASPKRTLASSYNLIMAARCIGLKLFRWHLRLHLQ